MDFITCYCYYYLPIPCQQGSKLGSCYSAFHRNLISASDMKPFTLLWMLLFSSIVWITQQKQVTFSSEPDSTSLIPLNLTCENGRNDKVIYVTGVTAPSKSIRREDLIQQYKIGCDNKSRCQIQYPQIFQGHQVQVIYQCLIERSNEVKQLITATLIMMATTLNCLNGKTIKIEDVFTSMLPSLLNTKTQLLMTRISAKCIERKQCSLFLSNNLPEQVPFTVYYNCMKGLERCRVTITGNFTGHTLLSASDMIIESKDYIKGSYIQPSDFKCRVTSTEYRYLELDMVEFRSEEREANYSMQFYSRTDFIKLNASQQPKSSKYSLYLQYDIYTHTGWFVDINMTWLTPTSKNVRLHLRIKAFDSNNQTASVNITCKKPRSQNIAKMDVCTPDVFTTTTFPASTPTAKGSLTTNFYTPSINNIFPMTSHLPITPKVQITDSQKFITRTLSSSPAQDVTDILTTPTIKSFITPFLTPTPQNQDSHRFTTSLPQIDDETPKSYVTSMSGNSPRNQDIAIEVLTSAQGTQASPLHKEKFDLNRTLTDIGWKIAVVGIFIVVIVAITGKAYCMWKNKKQKMKKRKASLALSEVSFCVQTYNRWIWDETEKKENRSHTLTTTFQNPNDYDTNVAPARLYPFIAQPVHFQAFERRPVSTRTASFKRIPQLQSNEESMYNNATFQQNDHECHSIDRKPKNRNKQSTASCRKDDRGTYENISCKTDDSPCYNNVPNCMNVVDDSHDKLSYHKNFTPEYENNNMLKQRQYQNTAPMKKPTRAFQRSSEKNSNYVNCSSPGEVDGTTSDYELTLVENDVYQLVKLDPYKN